MQLARWPFSESLANLQSLLVLPLLYGNALRNHGCGLISARLDSGLDSNTAELKRLLEQILRIIDTSVHIDGLACIGIGALDVHPAPLADTLIEEVTAGAGKAGPVAHLAFVGIAFVIHQ
jgi:hypothetical protein